MWGGEGPYYWIGMELHILQLWCYFCFLRFLQAYPYFADEWVVIAATVGTTVCLRLLTHVPETVIYIQGL